MLALFGRREVLSNLLIEILWPDPDLQPLDTQCNINRHIFLLRWKLRSFGYTIINRHNFAWRLAPAEERKLPRRTRKAPTP